MSARARTPAGQGQLDLFAVAEEGSATPEDAPTYSAEQLARLLRLPAPTPEQVAVIEAPPEPGVVVAGAGSGKTETMASRVVWLVANGHVLPEQILGLTFTRKAARELAARIRRRLGQLRARGLGLPTSGASGELAEAGEATVATYDAYAQRIVAEHALRLGHEPGARLVTPAMAWQYAARVAEAYDGPMEAVDSALSTVIEAVLSLHGELSGHLVQSQEVAEFTERLQQTILAKPRVARTKAAVHSDIGKALTRQEARRQLLPLVASFEEAKRHREAVDFADLAALAARLAEGFPEVGERERDRYRVVLLDEYQDTSHAQLVLLRGLFGAAPARGRKGRASGRGHPVTTVGDPCQSIYGWRGASAETLQAFGRHFPTAAGEHAPTRSLRTSFRNGSSILAAANALSAPLRAAGLVVPELVAHPTNGRGEVVAACHATVDDEAIDIAEQAAQLWSADADRRTSGEDGRTVAVLVRRRSQIERIVRALRARDLPVEVVGVGGLLATPAVADVVATLQVLADPTRGDALMRLLTGARWRLGPRDLDALGRWARWLSKDPATNAAAASAPTSGGDGSTGNESAGPAAERPVAADDPKAVDLTFDETDERSIVDALDALPDDVVSWGFSAEGHRRLGQLAAELRRLRSRMAQDLVDLVADVARTLSLDIEVAARTGDVAVSRADLDAFADVAADFAGSGEGVTLSAFLAYLAAAETEERGLEPGQVEVADDRIQVLTVHGAKGLEWDAVFVAGMVDKVFPGAGGTDKAWLTDLGALPFPLRGDSDALPRLDVDDASDQGEVKAAYDTFVTECGDRARLEERRLAYVAVTRARQLVYCSGYRWDDATRPRVVGEFLAEIAEVCRQGEGTMAMWAPEPEDGATNPVTATPRHATWPVDPLSEQRRAEVASGAAMVTAARADLEAGTPPTEEAVEAAGVWARDVDLLLAERARRSSGGEVVVELPDHLSVSQLVLLRRDPQLLARQLRRPVPSRPNPLARRGTAFHSWLERRFGSPHLLDLDELPGAADESPGAEDELAALQEAFLASEWAGRQPVEVEAPFELVIAGVVVRGRADAVFPLALSHDDAAAAGTPAGAGGAAADGDAGEAADADGAASGQLGEVTGSVSGVSGVTGLEVVDWKTGRPPSDPDEEAARAVQLAAYRLAWAQLRGLSLHRVRAAFHYVRSNTTVRPIDLLDRAGLEDLVTNLPERPER